MNETDRFGEILKGLREQKRLTLRQVAEVVGIDTSTLGKLEKGSRNATTELINALSDFYNIERSILYTAHKSDIVAYKILDNEDDALEILRVAEEKVKYSKNPKNKNI